jgi:DNA-binding transcriptional regulator/RsmH inhibitor MraZ
MSGTKKYVREQRQAVKARKSRATVELTTAVEPCRIDKRGTVVIPAALRRRYDIEEGTLIIAEPARVVS